MKRAQGKPPANGGSGKGSPGKGRAVAKAEGAASAGGAAPRKRSTARIVVAALIPAAVVVVAGLAYQFFGGGSVSFLLQAAEAPGAATFVGSDACAACHKSEAASWHASQHALAMDHATDKSVLGDFHDVSFEHGGVKSRFFRQDGKFMVETDGPDGKLAAFEVKYTFGVDPLQQYLVPFPDGRIQALPIAWDTRPREQGGQRWFHLYPNEAIPHDDVLHWTKLNQNWNFMCAECHSTGVKKNYDAARDRFATTWAEINVGCEACHGQGSSHVAWAHAEKSWWPAGKSDDPQKGLLVRFDDRTGVSWTTDPATGNPHRSMPPDLLRKEVETCGLCHARRAEFSEAWVPGRWLSDTHSVSTLAHGLYQADGQMLDEVYNYGSFKQSRMFAAGVSCSDCHDPHSAELRLPGDGVCLQCHQPAKYETASHSHHEGVTPAIGCPACHMPARNYMVVDTRHDHSFRVPRPDLSVSLGTPNACNDCHRDKTATWAAAAVAGWFGPKREGFQTYAAAFDAAWNDRPGASALLAAVAGDPATPAIARASALTELAARLSPANIDLARTGLGDRDPVVRIGALDMIESLPARQRWTVVSPLLSDPLSGVRIRAVSLLADVPASALQPADRAIFERVADEFIASHRLNADRPESRSALGSFYRQQGRTGEAEVEYKAALKLSPQYAPASVNLADLYGQLGHDDQAEQVLRAAIMLAPADAGLHHALGLALVRLKRSPEAVSELGRAAELDPADAHYAYVYAVALHSTGDAPKAISILKDSQARHPEDRDTLVALIDFSREAGDAATALQYAEQLLRLAPDDQELKALVEGLRRGSR